MVRRLTLLLSIPICIILGGCSRHQSNSTKDKDSTIHDFFEDSMGQEKEVDYRKDFISLYSAKTLIDTTFSKDGKQYEIIFKHFCTLDSSLIIPAKYNFDTKKDFTTHNFQSELSLLTDHHVIFKKEIDKRMFAELLDSTLNSYGALLYPNLSIRSDSIQIEYSISIPVSDIGIGVKISFNFKGNYTIEK